MQGAKVWEYHSGEQRQWIGMEWWQHLAALWHGTASNKPLGQQSGEQPSCDGGPDHCVMETCPWTLSQWLGTFGNITSPSLLAQRLGFHKIPLHIVLHY